MKISFKIKFFILINLILHLISFGLTQFYNERTHEYRKFSERIRDFESGLLNTVVLERDCAKNIDEETSDVISSKLRKSKSTLENIIKNAPEKEGELRELSKLLTGYMTEFTKLANNHYDINLLKNEWDKVFNALHRSSDILAQEIDKVIGTAYIDGEEIDPLCNSFAISNKNAINALSGMSLALNRDLLLRGSEEAYLKAYQKNLEVLNRERKNMPSLAKAAKRDILTDFSVYAEENLVKTESVINDIHRIWQRNTEILLRLDAVRGKMVRKVKKISSWIQMSMDNIRKKNFIFAIIIVCTILGVLIIGGSVILRSINRPIRKLMDMVIDLARGEGDLSMRLKLDDGNEMGELARWFNIFIQNIEDIIREITQSAETLTASSYSSLKLSSRMSSGASRMDDISNSVSSATEEVSVNINTMASATEEMSVNIRSVSSTAGHMYQNMEFVASAIQDMSEAINDITRNARKGGKVSDEAMDMAKTATSAMNTLGEAAKEIGEVTKVITRIAEQTNLLALNATIEAASAGNAGRGFGVVANEIKELANQSARAAENIARRIQGIQKNTKGAVRIIDDVSDIIGAINASVLVITNAVEQQSVTAEEVMSNVQNARTGAKNIASAIAEVAKGANDMSGNASEAVRGADEAASNIQRISQAAKETNSGAKQVNNSAEELARIAVQLEEMVGRFRVGSGKGDF